MTSENPPVDLYKALLAAKRQIPKMGKDARNKFFEYRSYEAMIAKIEPVLEANGILINASTVSIEESSAGNQSKTTVAVDYTLIHVESGQSMTSRFYGTGMDPSDKATTKAYTYARKAMFLQVMGISSEDPDASFPQSESAVDRAEKVAKEGEQKYKQYSKDVAGAADEESASRAVNAYRGWFMNAGKTTPDIAWSASVEREVDGTVQEVPVSEYLKYLGSRLRLQSEGYTS